MASPDYVDPPRCPECLAAVEYVGHYKFCRSKADPVEEVFGVSFSIPDFVEWLVTPDAEGQVFVIDVNDLNKEDV